MEKRNIIIPAACLVALVWGCAPELEAANQPAQTVEAGLGSSPMEVVGTYNGGTITHTVLRDTETGCQYIAFYNGGTVVRLASDGKPMCGGGAR